jgi:hypothetical protein
MVTVTLPTTFTSQAVPSIITAEKKIEYKRQKKSQAALNIKA